MSRTNLSSNSVDKISNGFSNLHLDGHSDRNSNEISKALVCFKISYNTPFGQHLAVLGSSPELGEWDVTRRVQLQWDGFVWRVEIPIEHNLSVEYKYMVTDDYDNIVRWEELDNKVLRPIPSTVSYLEVRDFWTAIPHGPERVFLSAAFRDVIYHRQIREDPSVDSYEVADGRVHVTFFLRQPLVKKHHRLFITGNCSALNYWEVDSAIQLEEAHFPYWVARVLVNRWEFPFEYKYFYTSTKNSKVVWEPGANRIFNLDPTVTTQCIVQKENSNFGWNWKGAAIAVPVFSLRTKRGLGVGEFPDIKLLVDWSVEAGLQMVQLLPVNSTVVHKTWWDTYPYSAISVFALHPIYINIDSLDPPKEVLDEINKNKPRLNEGFLQYEEVMNLKYKLLRITFDAKKKEFIASEEFQQFLEANRDWLLPYALFCYLRDQNGTANFYKWKQHSDITRDQIPELTSPEVPYYDELAFEMFIQFHLDKQLQEASDYAKENGVIFKGDLPIGVDPHSVDTWIDRDEFNVDKQAGAPPDQFAEEGQNWGFPTYNWEKMRTNNYAWWRRRLSFMEKYFQAYRIDHILGFFRIWEIPYDRVGGLIGRFNPSIPIFRSELSARGIWDLERLTEPYICYWHFQMLFPQEKIEDIISTYFDEKGHLVYSFKPEFATEVQLFNHLNKTGLSPFDQWLNAELLSKLLYLMRNIVLIQDQWNPDAFYPRINIRNSTSFKALPDSVQEDIYRLYVSYYFERQEELWAHTALERLEMMQQASKMMTCGEDLGMLPKCVDSVLDNLSIISLRVQRMPKDPKLEFEDCKRYPYMSVATPSVHDSTTLRGWWEEDMTKTAFFYRNWLLGRGAVPKNCKPWIVENILRQHFWSPSMWVVFLIQDLFAMSDDLRVFTPDQERINNPANRHHNWNFRIHINLEDLLKQHKQLTYHIREMVNDSGRLSN